MGNQTLAIPPLNAALTALEPTANSYDATGLRRDGTCSTTSTDCITGVSRATEFTYDDVGRLITERTMELDPLPVERVRTETSFDAAGRRTAVDYFTDAAASPDDAIEFSYDVHDRLTAVERGGTTLLSGSTYNPDGTQATQTTPAGTATFSYDRRDRLTGATSPLFSGSVAYDWTNDGVLDERTWPGGASASYAYDAARRPTGMTVENGTITFADFGRSLDRVGNVTSETQTLDGVTGFAGSETQSFTYDSLRRLLTSSISDGTTSDARSYAYDAGSRRTNKTENGVTTSYAYDRNDQLVSQTIGSGSASSFVYDAYGRLTTRPSAGGSTTYAYDSLDRLVGITAPSGEEETFSLDALGRKWTRSLDAVLTDTYTYLDASYDMVRMERPSLTVDSAIDAIGTRIATGTGGGDFGFALPDLHGNFAAAMADDAATVSDAFRYDGYGHLLDEATSTLPTPWRFQGKPLLSEVGEDLYDFESRAYDPGTGTFTQLDTFAGAVQNPLTLNRFLYAHANPTTLIDPDGHCPVCRPMIDGVRHQHAKPPKQTLSYAPPKPTFRLPFRPPPRIATVKPKPGSGKGHARTPWNSVTPAVHIQNPSNLPWVGQPVADVSRTEHLRRSMAAFEATPECGPNGCGSLEEAVLGIATTFTIARFGALAFRAASALVSAGGGTACLQYCDDVAIAVESLGPGPATRLPNPAGGVAAGPVRGGIGPVQQGQAGVERTIADLEAAGGRVLGREITIEAGRMRSKVDLFVQLPNGQQAFFEVKTGASAALTTNQASVYPQLRSAGGIPRGANAASAGLDPGVPIGPTPVWVIRQPWP
jgi:RHS repeat-associated protein